MTPVEKDPRFLKGAGSSDAPFCAGFPARQSQPLGGTWETIIVSVGSLLGQHLGRREGKSLGRRKAVAPSVFLFLAQRPLSLAHGRKPGRPLSPHGALLLAGISGAGGVLISGLCLMWVLRWGMHWIWGSPWSIGLPCCSVTRLVGQLWVMGEANLWKDLDWMGGEVPFCCLRSRVSASASTNSLGDSFS